MSPSNTVAALLLGRIDATPLGLAFRYPTSDGSFAETTWADVGARVESLARGLLALGLTHEQGCAIIASTRVEWILADLAVLCAGGVTTTVYPSSRAEDRRFILRDSGASFAFVENLEQLAKLREFRDELPELRRVIVIEGEPGRDDWVMSLASLEQLGRAGATADPAAFRRVARAVRPDQLATIIYTSGTTGRPKGVRLTHDGWVYQSEVAEKVDLFRPDDHQLLWLPLSHAFGKVLEVCALRVGFATTVDGRVTHLMENLEKLQPTFMGAPPRIFEKIYAKLTLAAAEPSGLRGRLMRWSMAVARAVSRELQAGREPNGFLALQRRVADALVFAKMRRRFGGRMRFMFSGSAPLPRELGELFHGAGLLILEGYGLTETSAGAVLNTFGAYRFGTVGKPLPGTELKLAEDGEVLLRSRGVMSGYQRAPDETREALGADGWLRTGDVGELDSDGFLKITDRKKDLIKSSAGLYIAPQRLESLLKACCPFIAHVAVHGDQRSHCSALIALDAEAIAAWAASAGAPRTYAELAREPRVRALIERAIERVNAAVPKHEAIRKFALLTEELTIESGLLTPSMKLRRKATEQRFRETLDALYDDAARPQLRDPP
jgi:long-chain acyl-CoA synthetase